MKKKIKAPILYHITCWLFRLAFKTLFKGRVYGLENIPKEGSFLIAANHVSFLDPIFITSHSPTPVYSFARKTLFKTRFLAWYYGQLDMIPIDREMGSDMGAFKRVIKVLRDGRGVVLFPEGRRSSDGQLQKPKRGVGLFACKMEVPVIPARIFGSFEAWNRDRKWPKFGTRIDVVYGKPIQPKDFDFGQSPTRYEQASEKIMEAIGRLQSPRGVRG